MKLVSYTVQVPRHHAKLMRTMGKILTDFEEVEGLAFVRFVLQDQNDPNFSYATDYALGAYRFDTDEEEATAAKQIREACRACVAAERLEMKEAA